MNIAAIISGIFAIAKAVPKLKQWWDEAVEVILQIQINSIKKEFQVKGAELEALHNSISKAGSNEERLALSSLLYKLSRK